MKTPEQFLREVITDFPDNYIVSTSGRNISIHWIIGAMEKYAIQSVDTACANVVVQIETLEGENRSHIDTINDQEYRIMELEKEIEYSVQLLQSWVHDHGPLNETINFIQAYWNKHNIFPYEP